ncbi:MAG TPA: hypothetical protein V6D22_15380 [Candidatus Obscuribacterales bacterium]
MDVLLDDTNALGMVRLEHGRLFEFMKSALESGQPEFTNQVTRALLRELDIHAALEQEFVYPFMKANLTEKDFKLAIRQDARLAALKLKLQSLDVMDEEYYPTLYELIEQFQLHRFAEDLYGLTHLEYHTPYVDNQLAFLAEAMERRRAEMLKRSTDVTSNRLASQQARVEHRQALQEEPRTLEQPRTIEEPTTIEETRIIRESRGS